MVSFLKLINFILLKQISKSNVLNVKYLTLFIIYIYNYYGRLDTIQPSEHTTQPSLRAFCIILYVNPKHSFSMICYVSYGMYEFVDIHHPFHTICYTFAKRSICYEFVKHSTINVTNL